MPSVTNSELNKGWNFEQKTVTDDLARPGRGDCLRSGKLDSGILDSISG